MTENIIKFPDGFIWGAATSAYQIEGSWDEEGRGSSIWDTFSRQRGRTHGGHTGNTAAGHYKLWKSDLDLMAEIGLKAYRFSIAWTRIIPQGSGAVNQAGIDFYSRLVDGLLERGITPYPTLFHYDLPQPLQDRGGWRSRDTAMRFCEYAQLICEKLSDRATHWITHNEPWVAAVLGHLTGEHAPGIRNPWVAVTAFHHMLLSHGLAAQAMRAAARQPVQIGIALNLSPVYPNDPKADLGTSEFIDSLMNRLYLDPLLKAEYPNTLTRSWWGRSLLKAVRPDDLKIIAAPLDFVGINYYTRAVVSRALLGRPRFLRPKDSEYSQMWEIYPGGLYDLLMRVHRDYNHPNLIVLENGVPVPDVVEGGEVRDHRRIFYLRDHILQTQRALNDGAPVTGYFVWSFLDNFEWALGYQMRFGMVYVDFETQQRIMKDSGKWYARVIRENGLFL